MLIDSHAHVHDTRFRKDREEMLQATFAGGVERIVDPGTDLETSRASLQLAQAFPGRIFTGVGTHPHDAQTHSDTVEAEYRKMVQEPEVVAIGEFGLDYYRDLSPRDIQREVFYRHLQLARDYNLPCIIHVRDSHDDVIELLRAHGRDLRGVFHCFSGTVKQAEECLEFAGFVLSFAGPLTREDNELPEVARLAPLDRILVETDSPYLIPKLLKAKRNEPLFVKRVAERLAEVRGLSLEEIAQVTTANTNRLFDLEQARTSILASHVSADHGDIH